MNESTLSITYGNFRRRIAPGIEITIGRLGDLALDDSNPHLHRLFASIGHLDDRWWISHLGTHGSISSYSHTSGCRTHLTPGSEAPLAPGRTQLCINAGSRTYTVDVELRGGSQRRSNSPMRIRGDGLATEPWGRVSLNEEQRQLLSVLAATRLADPAEAAAPLPSNRAATAALGWTITKFNRKLDHLCRKFANAGVPGLVGDIASLARDRRDRLVTHVIETGLITSDDVECARAARHVKG